MFDDATSDAQHVRIRTAHEFFAFNYVYTYEGVVRINFNQKKKHYFIESKGIPW